jgi:hypothetical protein
MLFANAAESQQCERRYDRFYSPCAGGEILDDGSEEHYVGYTSTASRRTHVQRFTPPSYPSVYHEVCVAWARDPTAPYSTISYEVVVYDDDGLDGEPGTLLAAVPTSADNVPVVFSDLLFSSTPVAVPAITEGSVYIGFRWDPSDEIDFFFPVDDSPSTPQQRIRSSSDDGSSWLYFTSLGRALFIRARSTSDYVVVPQELEFTHGNTYDTHPFSVPYTRYQQVFQGSEVGARWISELRFRAAWQMEDPRLCPDLLEGLTIALSTTQKPVDGLSTTFSENVGPDETIVFDGDIWLQARGSGNRLPLPFDIAIPLQKPYYFSGDGNLFLDINLHDDFLYRPYRFDTHGANDGISMAICADLPWCPYADTAFFADTQGVVTMFLVGAHTIFVDGFESGDTTAWSSTVP